MRRKRSTSTSSKRRRRRRQSSRSIANASTIVLKANQTGGDEDRQFELTGSVEWQDLEAAAAAAGESGGKSSETKTKKLRRFSMLAYTGAKMRFWWAEYPVIVDISGLVISSKSRPILREHNPGLIVGHTESIRKEKARLSVIGVISGGGESAREVIESADNGFPWQASIGTSVERMELVKEGAEARVNGSTVAGPVYIVRKATLGEVSFVALGADDNTSATIAAHIKPPPSPTLKDEDNAMTFAKWLKAKGFEEDKLTDAQRKSLKAMYDAEMQASQAAGDHGDRGGQGQGPGQGQGGDGNDPTSTAAAAPGRAPAQTVAASAASSPHGNAPGASPPSNAPAAGGDANANGNVNASADLIASMRSQAAQELKRINKIKQIFAGRHPDLEAKAIEEGWDETRAELEAHRANLPTIGAPYMATAIRNNSHNVPTERVLEAAACLAGGLHEIENHFDERTLEAADRQFHGELGLQELVLECAWANGYTGRGFRNSELRHILQAAFSTFTLPGILSNTANKFLLAGFMAIESTWKAVAATRSVRDFKQITSYRLTGDFKYEEVGPDGELKHGSVGEESFTNQAKTYGRMWAITRTDLINDDLGALTSTPQRLGRGGGLKLCEVFWTEFLDNGTFFAAGNNNYKDGADTALAIESLTVAEQMFLDQKDPDKNPLGILPKTLLVPNGLNVLASNLMRSTEVRPGGGNSKKTELVTNPHAGKFSVQRSSYLSAANINGSSAVAWYLLADPRDLPVIEVCFLNGMQAPTVETANAAFNVLGIEMRGYHDFGVNKQEFRAGVKMKGEA